MKTLNAALLIIFSSIIITSCKNEPKFTVSGIIKGSEGDTIYLEKREFSNTIAIDSIITKQDGSFTFSSPSPKYPELYLVRLNNQYINLAIDSIESITIKTSKNNFATDYSIDGSENSQRMKDVILAQHKLQKNITKLKNQFRDNLITQDSYISQIQQNIDEYKEFAKGIILADLKSPTAYFTLFQKVEDLLIFSPYQKEDSRLYSAIATAWDNYYNGSPKAEYLKDFTLKAIKERKKLESKTSLFENLQPKESSEYYRITLPNIYDNMIPTESLKGKVILLDFTVYQAEYSPIHNIHLNKIYEKHKTNMEIYQVSFDTDTHIWKNAALNLPWICVRDANSTSSELVSRFNIQELPSMYLINRQGDLVKRLTVKEDIESKIKKLF